MADDVNKIIVDYSFFAGIDGKKDVGVSFSPQDLNFIGYRNIFTDVSFREPEGSFKDIIVDLNSGEEEIGNKDIPTWFVLNEATVGGLDNYVNYFTGDTIISGAIGRYVDCTLSRIFAPSSKEVYLSYIQGREYEHDRNIPISLFVLEDSTESINMVANYVNFTGYRDFYYIPTPAWEGYLDFETEYTTVSGIVVGWDRLVEVFFAGWVPHNILADVYCSNLLTNYILTDVELASGAKYGVRTECRCSELIQEPLFCDLYCSLVDYIEIGTDIALISGSKQGIRADLYSCYEKYDPYFLSDIRVFPIYFDNFSLYVGDYMSVSGTVCVDAHDGFFNLLASGTYFKINDEKVGVTLTELEDGYRVCYDPDDDFYSLSGVTKFTAHAENDNGDILEEDFYLTFGYIVEFDNKDRIGFDYGFNNRVTVRVEAENLASCPTVINEGYWFVSEDLIRRDLSASIICEGAVKKDNKNLQAEIYPHSTAYFYDKEIKVVLTAKDFNGNEMEPFELNFKIRNDG